MNVAQSASLIGLIPFRVLLSIARALGGVGADPHRLAGGKSGLADALVKRYGADAILAKWQEEQSTPPQHGTPAPHHDAPEGDDSATPPEGSDTEGSTQGDATPGDAQGDAPTPTQQNGTATPTPAQGDAGNGDAGNGDAPEGDAPEQAPKAPEAGDAPPPPPERESPMDAAIRAIASEEAYRALYPHALWAEQMVAYANRHAAGPHGTPTPEGDAPRSPSGPPPAPYYAPPRKGDAVQHRLAPKLLALLAAGAQPLLVGPAGTGKSHAARAAAQTLGYAYGDQSLSAGVSESALMGWLLPRTDGPGFAYMPSPFVRLYEAGHSLFLLDEMDAASPDMLVIANAALSNGGFTVPQRQEAPYVARGQNALIMGACNTINGADEQYSARVQIDAATANRFYTLIWPHDPRLERALAGLPAKQRYWKPEGITAWTPEQWHNATESAIAWVDTVRATINANALQRVFSMRQVRMYQQALSAGCTHKEIREDLLMAWAPDEIAKLPPTAQPKNAPQAGNEAPTPTPTPTPEAQ